MSFEAEDRLFPFMWIVVRIDGSNFSGFSCHKLVRLLHPEFQNPNNNSSIDADNAFKLVVDGSMRRNPPRKASSQDPDDRFSTSFNFAAISGEIQSDETGRGDDLSIK